MLEQFIVGKPTQDTIKNCYVIGGDITRRICISEHPLEELKYLIDLCSSLWDMHIVTETNDVKQVVLKTEQVIV